MPQGHHTCLHHEQQPLDDQSVDNIVFYVCLHSVQTAFAEQLYLYALQIPITGDGNAAALQNIVMRSVLATTSVLQEEKQPL